jgi:acetoacetyl-CoA reductase
MNPRVLVVGGSRGIGRQAAVEFAKRGSAVAITYQTNDGAAVDAEKDIGSAGGVFAGAWKFEASSEFEAQKNYEAVIEKLGGVDVLVHCAGITRDKTFKKMDFKLWQDVINVNLNSAFHSCKAVLPGMVERNFGRVILLSSVIGQAGGFGQANYAASKAAMVGFVKSLAREYAIGDITVNALCPGFVQTEMTKGIPSEVTDRIISSIPKKRFASADEVAHAILFLASPMSGYITGQAIGINGGLYM